MSEQTKKSPRGTNSSFWPREKLPELHLVCLQARFFGFTRQPEGFIWCVQQGMNWSLAWILLVTPHHTVIGAALKQTVRERRRKKLRCERPPWSDSSPRCLLLDDLWPLSTAVSGCSLVFTDRWRHWWSVPHRVTCDVMMTYTYHQSKRNSDTVLVSLWNSFPSQFTVLSLFMCTTESHRGQTVRKCVSLTTFGCFITQTETHQTHSILWQSWGLTLGHSQPGTVMTERDHSETQHNTFIFRWDQITHQYHLLWRIMTFMVLNTQKGWN